MKRVALCGVLLSACTGGEEADVTDRVSAAAMAQAVCVRQAECCPGNSESETQCRTSIERVIEPLFRLEGIAIDEAAGERCLGKIAGMSCEDVAGYAGRPPIFLVCEPFHRGTLPLGASCFGNTIAENFYDDDRCESATCSDGICAEPPVVRETPRGRDCSQDGLCSAPYECFGEPLICEEPQVIAVGEQCGPGK